LIDESRSRIRGVHVFDVSQTDGEPQPVPAEVSGDPCEHLATLRAHITERGIELDNDDLPPGAVGVSRGGRISVREGLVPANEFSVLVHELAHELLHRGEDRPKSKTVRETEAEAVAFVVCQATGLESGTAANDYIQLYDGKQETLVQSLDRIQRVSTESITALTPGEQAAWPALCLGIVSARWIKIPLGLIPGQTCSWSDRPACTTSPAGSSAAVSRPWLR